MGTRECPAWCARHSPARCRSEPVVVAWAGGRYQVAVQLERWADREVALSLLLPDGVLLLPLDAAVALGEAWQVLCGQAGWTAAGQGRRPLGRSLPQIHTSAGER